MFLCVSKARKAKKENLRKPIIRKTSNPNQQAVIMKINQNQPFSLRAIVGELIDCYAKSGNHSCQVINNVPSDLTLVKNVDWLAPLIGDLLSILSHADSSQPILVSAMKTNGGYKLYAVGKHSSFSLPGYNSLPSFNTAYTMGLN